MTFSKLPLIVPKKALSTTTMLVPKLSPALLAKSSVLSKSLHTGAKFPPNKPVEENPEGKPSEKSTKLAKEKSLFAKKLRSKEGDANGLDYTKEYSNSNQNGVHSEYLGKDGLSKGTLSNSWKSSNNSFQEDLVTRLNRSNMLNELTALNKKKSNKEGFLVPDKPVEKSVERSWDETEDVGYTPWLKVERRINQIRSLAARDSREKSAKNSKSQVPNLYSNYKTRYEEDEWRKEVTHPLSYGMVQKLNDKKRFDVPKDNWKLVDGLLRPRRPFASMSELSKYFKMVDTRDQYELIKLLLACRDLEKVIEEQHTVLDMLDHDLREDRDLFPDSLKNVTTENLFGSTPEEEPFYPSSEVPLFLKGRLMVSPKNPKGNK